MEVRWGGFTTLDEFGDDEEIGLRLDSMLGSIPIGAVTLVLLGKFGNMS